MCRIVLLDPDHGAVYVRQHQLHGGSLLLDPDHSAVYVRQHQLHGVAVLPLRSQNLHRAVPTAQERQDRRAVV